MTGKPSRVVVRKGAVDVAGAPVQDPALEPVPPDTSGVERSYKVTGTQRTLDHNPGETFSATLTPEREQFYLDGGHLTITQNTER